VDQQTAQAIHDAIAAIVAPGLVGISFLAGIALVIDAIARRLRRRKTAR
jgi:hypothetical protein